jgi:Domain of unknown function (DUF4281)
MKADLLFRIANNIALLGWLILIFLPRWRWGARLISPVLIPALLSSLYAALVVTQFGHSGGFSSLASVSLLFRNPYMLLAGWVHYLAFDLFVGSWEVRDSQRRGIEYYLVVPCLILTFLFGPAGWFLYFLIRSIATGSAGVNDTYAEEISGAEAANPRARCCPSATSSSMKSICLQKMEMVLNRWTT